MRHRVAKVLPYAPDQLFDLVGDVAQYPQFIPWITALRTWNTRDLGQGVHALDAEVSVRFAAVSERFSTHVLRDSVARRIEVGLISGPFRSLANRWSFQDDPAGTRLEFEIDFEFKSRILSALLASNFHHAVDRLIACFETRARALYGPAR